MKKTYTRTMMHADLTKATVEIEVHEALKWEATQEDSKVVTYSGIKAWSIVSGEDAAEIESMTDASGIDEYHEYLVLHFTNGETATFRNSHVDMFIW